MSSKRIMDEGLPLPMMIIERGFVRHWRAPGPPCRGPPGTSGWGGWPEGTRARRRPASNAGACWGVAALRRGEERYQGASGAGARARRRVRGGLAGEQLVPEKNDGRGDE